jgi:ketosteroid isomerase-like protein
MTAGEVADRLALRELVDAYGFAADDRDASRFASLWTDDARLVIRNGDQSRELVGRDTVLQVVTNLGRYQQTFHLVANHRCTVDGDEATGETYCLAQHIAERNGVLDDRVLTIRYLDRYRRDGGQWRFAVREVHVLWRVHQPVERP